MLLNAIHVTSMTSYLCSKDTNPSKHQYIKPFGV